MDSSYCLHSSLWYTVCQDMACLLYISYVIPAEEIKEMGKMISVWGELWHSKCH